MDKLDQLLKQGFGLTDSKIVRKLKSVTEVKGLKISPRGRLSVPKIIMQSFELYKYSHYLPLVRENPRELCLYLMDDNELVARENIKAGIKQFLLYKPELKDDPNYCGTTSYFELGPQFKSLKMLDKKGFILNFRVEDNKVIILSLDKKY